MARRYDPTTGKLVPSVVASGGGGGGTVTSVAGGIGITNTPEPIVGAGTVDLDLNSLTTQATLASGDLFGFVDVSIGTTPSAQRKATLGNILTGLEAIGINATLLDGIDSTGFSLAGHTHAHASLTGIGPNDHHAQVHVLATGTALGPDHTISGAAAGEVLRALSATTAAFDVLQHADLGGVTANQHHNQSHVLATGTALGPDHTISGAAAGEVLRALSATTAAFDVLQHTDLGGVTADQHHAQSHVLATTAGLGADHTTSGLTAGQVLRASGATTAAFASLNFTDLAGVASDAQIPDLNTLSTALTPTHIVFVSGANQLNGNAGLTWDNSLKRQHIQISSAGGLTGVLTGTGLVIENGAIGGDDAYLALVASSSGDAGISFGYNGDVDEAQFRWDSGNLGFEWVIGATEEARLNTAGLRLEPAGVTADAREALDVIGDAIVTGFLMGGKATTDDLDLHPHSDAGTFTPADAGRIRVHERVVFDETFSTSSPFSNQALIRLLGTATFSNAVWQWSGFQYDAEVEWTVGAGFTTAPTFDAHGIFEKQTTSVDAVSIFTGFYSRGRYRSNVSSGVATAMNFVGFSAGMETLANIGAGTGGITNLTAFDAYAEFTFGTRLAGTYAIDTFRGLYIAQPTKAAGVTITDQVGVEILDLTHGTGVNLSLRSAGANVGMRHAGPGVFGANAAPANASVGLEVQSTTRAFLLPRMTTTQRDAMTPVDGMMIYNTTTAVIEGREAGAWVNL
jgi:hypothetical protein